MLNVAVQLYTEGNRKRGALLACSIYDNVPEDILEEVKAKVELLLSEQIQVFPKIH